MYPVVVKNIGDDYELNFCYGKDYSNIRIYRRFKKRKLFGLIKQRKTLVYEEYWNNSAYIREYGEDAFTEMVKKTLKKFNKYRKQYETSVNALYRLDSEDFTKK